MDGAAVIIGSGQAGAQIAISLRELGHQGPITIIGEEPHPPYQRPPLSKTFLKGDLTPDRIYLRPPHFYASRGIDLVLGRTVGALNPRDRTLTFADGEEMPYHAAVIAAGSSARPPALPGLKLQNVFSLRKIADVEAFRPAITSGSRIVILGGGYIGLEVASALRAMNTNVILLEAEDRVLKRVTSEPVSSFFEAMHREHGTDILTGVKAAGLEGETQVASVRLAGGRSVPADAVLVATGAAANTELAAVAGLDIDGGIVVDEYGRTSAPGVYACGDCTSFPSRRYGRLVRLESVQNAIDQAKAVAAAIMGDPVPYDPVPWFWSDQYASKLQIAGLFSPGDRISVSGEPGAGPFAVEYRRDGRLVAVDAIDNARAHMQARRRIAEETDAAGRSLNA
jgi:3-phenylpropionate/trans-cinnamate dioxygenase ferredoxin reductase component